MIAGLPAARRAALRALLFDRPTTRARCCPGTCRVAFFFFFKSVVAEKILRLSGLFASASRRRINNNRGDLERGAVAR